MKAYILPGKDLKTQMDIVYHSLNDTSKGIIDVACCGAFKQRSVEEAKKCRGSKAADRKPSQMQHESSI